jgi:hypothetical protein
MKTFKNTRFTTRTAECTNVVFCQGESPPENYVEVDEIELDLSGCEQLYIQNGIKFFGYL